MASTTEARAPLASRIGDTLKFWGFCTASWLAGHAPLWFSYWVAARIGDFIYTFWHEHSGNAVSNMARVLGPQASTGAVRRAARLSFHNYIQVLIDFIRIPHLRVEQIERAVEGRGWEHLHSALARGKGVLLVGCHSGNWDFAGIALSGHKLPLTAVADQFRPARLNEFVVAQRQRMGVNTVPADAGSVRKLFEALRRNEIVMLFVDRPVPGEGVEVQFFGEKAWVPPGPAAIALKTGATIVPGFFIRSPKGHGWVGAFDPPIQPTLSGDKERDIQAVSQQIMHYMEAVIRRSPTQWYMFRPMWPRIALAPRWRRTERAGAALAGVGMGVSVDPPVIEDWSRGTPAEEPGAAASPPVPSPRPRSGETDGPAELFGNQ